MNSGSSVSTPNGLLPFFLTELSPSRNWFPLANTLGALCPGTVFPPWLIQLTSGVPLASITTETSVFPNPLKVPFAINEPRVNVTLDNLTAPPAETGVVIRTIITKTDHRDRNFFFIVLLL